MDHLQKQHAFDQIEMHLNTVKEGFLSTEERDEAIEDLEEELEEMRKELDQKETKVDNLECDLDEIKKIAAEADLDDPDSMRDALEKILEV